jgi:acetyltransferase-like isoleucine patch superfamily enzyme
VSQFHLNLKLSFWDRLRCVYCRWTGAQVPRSAAILRGAELLRFPRNIALGEGTVVKKYVQLCACNAAARISLGNDTTIGDYSYIYASESIRIGDKVLIAPFCYIVDGNHGTALGTHIRDQPLSTGAINVEDDVWLGVRVTLLPGVTVHRGAIVAAGSVVTRSVPAYEIWGGIPAKKIGMRRA